MTVNNTMTCRTERGIPVLSVDNIGGFDVKKTFDCGQCFRFEPVPDSRHDTEFSGVARGKLISVAQDGNTLYIYNSDEADYMRIWRAYLGLDTDYDAIRADILSRSSDPSLADAVAAGEGIRILRQEPWETVCSFIISQNNNIPRIKKIISSLCRGYGAPVPTSGMELHGGGEPVFSFPDAAAVAAAGLDGIFALKTGFRARYIIDAAQRCTDGRVDLDAVAEADTARGAEMLKSIKGVGDKVAACSLLFGFGRLDAFPVDVWIRRVIEKYFGEGFEPDSLGAYAGVAQQYLFYNERWLSGSR